MTKPTILVTGGTGYIGSHTAVELLQKGYKVVIVDNLSNSFKDVVDAIEKIAGSRPEFIQADLCNKEQVKNVFSKYQIDSVIHFAAFKAVGESVEKPLDYYFNNLVSLINLLQILPEYKINKFVFSSSCSVYGEPDKLPVKEDTPVKKAESPYANTKQIGEEMLQEYSKVSTIKTIALRYFNPVGAHESALIGELPINKPNNLVPLITQTAIGKREKLEVYGDDYETPDGSCIRDYIHVVDVAKAHVSAIDRLMKDKGKSNFEIFNLGTGQGSSVLDVIHTFERVTGVKLNYSIVARRPGDVVKVYADTSFANKELNWKTQYNLDEMLTSAWKWEQSLKNKKYA